MKLNDLIEKLMNFGLTRQEALIYHQLSVFGMATGYEVAKELGISRSNAYNSLASMVEKGAAYLQNGTTSKYGAVSVNEFCGNKVRNLQNDQKILEENLKGKEETEGYVTIYGYQNIFDKISNMLESTEKRVYISIENDKLLWFRESLYKLISEEKKVVIITDKHPELENACVYISNKLIKDQIRLIVDSRYVLTGDFGQQTNDTCLYSGQKNFVSLFKEAMRNEIELIELRRKQNDED